MAVPWAARCFGKGGIVAVQIDCIVGAVAAPSGAAAVVGAGNAVLIGDYVWAFAVHIDDD